MNALFVTLILLFITCVGYMTIWGFHLLPRQGKLFALACSHGLGVGLVTLQLFLYSSMGIAWNGLNLLISWIIFVVAVVIIKRKQIHFIFPKIPKLSRIQTLLLCAILLTVGYVVFEALLRPAVAWDSWANWLLMSKIFFLQGRIIPGVFTYLMTDYPPIVGLLGTYVYILLGHVDDTSVLLTSSAFYIFLGLAMFVVVRKKFGVTYALLITFLLFTTQTLIRQGGRLEAGQADLPLGYYAFVSCLLFFEYIKGKNKKVFILLQLFIAMTALVKLEGVPIALIIEAIAFYSIRKTKLYTHMIFTFFFIVPVLSWPLYKYVHQLGSSYFVSHPFYLSGTKVVGAFVGSVSELVSIKSWNMLWIVYFYSLFFLKRKTTEQTILAIIIVPQLVLYILLYMFTFGNDPNSSFERLLVHIAPLALFYCAISFSTVTKRYP